MAVNGSKEMSGSIGGGMMEHKMVELALDKMSRRDPAIVLKKQIHRKDPKENQSGMICSGEQTLVIHPAMHEEANLVQQIVDRIEQNISTQVTIEPSGISIGSPEADATVSKGHFLLEANQWRYEEVISNRKKAYIIGAGHVGMAMSKLLFDLGFYVVLMDNRKELNTFVANQHAHEKRCVDYETIGKEISEGMDVYIIVMSFGYRTDEIIAKQLIGKKCAYLGIMGSKAKMEVMWDQLRKDGFSDQMLGTVKAPIGIPIHSQTPMEIAVSIAAEIIQIKNQPAEI